MKNEKYIFCFKTKKRTVSEYKKLVEKQQKQQKQIVNFFYVS